MKVKAKESTQVVKARQKLIKQIKNENKQLTHQALEKERKVMRQWIARHAPERIDLNTKSFILFDENQHSANVENKYVLKKLKNLKGPARSTSKLSLAGRIKHTLAS